MKVMKSMHTALKKTSILLTAACLSLAPLAAQDDTIIPMGDAYSPETADYDYVSDALSDEDGDLSQTGAEDLSSVSGYTNEQTGYFVAVL
ncbi:MAG: hypothetical protein J6Y13_04315, partial [Treponema sp.]|nr:hypothetical protein [Treponema sp.]